MVVVLLLATGAAPMAWADDVADCSDAGDVLIKTDPARVVFACRHLVDQGYPWAQNALGFLYNSGQGVPQDYASAVILYRKAADQGFAKAQYNVGLMYYSGQGVTRDYAQALKWFRKAADQGFAPSEYNIGVFYESGLDVPKDLDEARRWYRLAAAQGVEGAKKALAELGDSASPATVNEPAPPAVVAPAAVPAQTLQFDQQASDKAVILARAEDQTRACMYDAARVYLRKGVRDVAQIMQFEVNVCGVAVLSAPVFAMYEQPLETVKKMVNTWAYEELTSIPDVTLTAP